MNSIQAVSPGERIKLLDVLRGFAIFGMFTVNMTLDIWWGDSLREVELSLADFVTVVLVDLFTNGKFITIFTFLYGIGFFVQMERTKARNRNLSKFHIRRSTGLLIIGVSAIAVTIPAWILVDYAVFGLGLIIFINRPPRIILIAALTLILVAKIFGGIIPDYRKHQDKDRINANNAAKTSALVESQETSQDEVLSTGNFYQVSSYRLNRIWQAFTNWKYYIGEADLLGLMLIGLFVARAGAVWDPEKRRFMARKALYWLIGIGFTGCLVFVIMEDFSVGDKTSIAHKIMRRLAAWPLGMPVLGLGYVAAITLLFEKSFWKKIFAHFASVGRTALTNYLFTGLVAAFMSFSWGLGLYGKLTAWQGLLVVFIIFPMQAAVSKWWINKFNFGPVEWLWRTLSYGSVQRMKSQD